MQNDMTEIGQRVQRLRDDRGLTQTQLAEHLGVADGTVVSKIEKGTRGLGVFELAKLCEVFGLRTDQLLFGTPEENSVGVMLRATGNGDVDRVVARVEEAFADLRYVRDLVES